MSRILVVGALPNSLIVFRGELLKALVAAGHDVTAMAAEPDSDVKAKLDEIGVDYKVYSLHRNGLNPIKDLQSLLELRKAFRELQPDLVLAYTIKPVIWGGLAFRAISESSFYALIEGLGFAFQGDSLSRRALGVLVSFLYRSSLQIASKVIFLNPDNRDTFSDLSLVDKSKTAIIDGIGLDLDWYTMSPLPDNGTVFLVISRLLGEKGLREYAKAAKIVKIRYPDTVFRLVGQPDPSPDGIHLDEVKKWVSEFNIEYLGPKMDVRPHLAGCHVYVLPSYHEGMPRTIMEAMATGRPILTTDVPGCRETVISGENGFLVPKADFEALAERMIWFIEHRKEWQKMGTRSRELAELRFDVHKINCELMAIMGLSVNGKTECRI